jgi:hypothetical protein
MYHNNTWSLLQRDHFSKASRQLHPEPLHSFNSSQLVFVVRPNEPVSALTDLSGQY